MAENVAITADDKVYSEERVIQICATNLKSLAW